MHALCVCGQNMLTVGTTVRVNRERKGFYYFGKVTAVKDTGFDIFYDEDETTDVDVQRADIIGPQFYTLKCPNFEECHNHLTSNYNYLRVPEGEPCIYCCSKCKQKVMKYTGFKKTHKRGSDEDYTWMQSNRKVNHTHTHTHTHTHPCLHVVVPVLPGRRMGAVYI